jgi:hypothetical protein
MVTEYTHNEYCDMLLTLGAWNSRAGSAAGNACYVTLVDSIQTLMSFDDWSSFL